MRWLGCLELIIDRIPDETAFHYLRHLLVKLRMYNYFFEMVKDHPGDKGKTILHEQILVPASLTALSFNMINERNRNSEMRQST